MKRLLSLGRLAFAFLRHLVLLPFVRRRGLAQISADFLPDGVRDVSLSERASGPAMSACTGCGRCDALVPEGEAPSLLLLRAARESADAPMIARRLRGLIPYAQAIASICPERVDVPALVLRIERLTHDA